MSYTSIYIPASDSYIYITGMLFFEELANFIPENKKKSGEKVRRIVIPKIITLISKQPLFTQMRFFIDTLYKRTFKESQIPLENIIKNLVFETSNINPSNHVISSFWKVSDLNIYNAKSDYFYHIFLEKLIYKRIPILLEKMIFGVPIILVSQSVYSLVALTEVLKTLLFPFDYQGFIMP